MSDVFLIAGATGRQGGATLDALVNTHAVQASRIFALTRSANGEAAQALRRRHPGVRFVEGNLNAPDAIFTHVKETFEAATSSICVFLAQAHGPTEVSDAVAFIDGAQRAVDVRHIVYSSVDRCGLADDETTGCKTFDDKFVIERHLKTLNANIAYTILRPTWFAENAIWGFAGKLCLGAWRASMNGKPLQVTVARDLGRWAAQCLIDAEKVDGRNAVITVTSDRLSFDEVDRMFRAKTDDGKGVPTLSDWQARLLVWMIADVRSMFAFLSRHEYSANIEWLCQRITPTSFETWLDDALASQR